MKIGLALSGGGVRATVFHLGVLARLAQQSLLENITFLSTVSGGTLAIALVHACSHNTWPRSDADLRHTLASSRNLLTEHALNKAYLSRLFFTPWTLHRGRANALAAALRGCWSVSGLMSDLPDKPRWIINSTCYETGKNWRFMKKRMGDYVAGYVASPQIPVAQAVATSAAFPGLVGSLRLPTKRFEWFNYDNEGGTKSTKPLFSRLRIWDGGVYENLGVESLFKPSGGYREGFDFLIVSDASAALENESRGFRAPLRLLKITTDQIRSLRARSVVSQFQRQPGTGAYLKIGNTEEHIYKEANQTGSKAGVSCNSLNTQEVYQAASFPTTLRRLTGKEFDLLFAHGYQVADATLSAYCQDLFQPIPLTLKEMATLHSAA